ncbi:MAG: T9SS type A sorting domain-containing protein [Lewinellaceae bacterium]|nr:T9SS type A sorting domain-containing protein [Lewinellaceae bacterium]
MNGSSATSILASNSSLIDTIHCNATIQSFKYNVSANTLARIVVTPASLSLVTPHVWVCNPDGSIITHDSTLIFYSPVSINVPPQPVNQCFYVFVADALGNRNGAFSISQAILAGSVPAASIQSAPSNGLACAGSDFALTASTNVDNPIYEWSGPNGFASTQASLTFSNVTAMQSGTYFLTITDEDGCVLLTASKPITVIDFDASVLIDPADGTLCEGQPFTLSADTDADTPTFAWVDHKGDTVSTQEIFATGNALPSQSGTYTLTVTDRYGCTESADTDITVHSLPSAAIDATPVGAAICEGEGFMLCASAVTSVLDYSWDGPLGFSSDQRCISFDNATPEQGGDYTLTVTDSNGCPNSESRTITVHPLPTAAFTPAGAEVCEGESFTLCYSADTSGLNFIWNGPSGFSSGVPCISFDNADATLSGTYMLTVTDANGCSQAASGDVIVHSLPTAAITPTPADGRVCEGAAFSLRAETDAGDPTYSWANPNGDLFSTQREVNFDETTAGQAGVYTLTVTDGNGCAQTASQNIHVISFSLETQNSPPSSEACEGDDLVIKAITGAENATYSWQGPGGFASELDSISFTNALPGQSGIYHVTVTDVNGCSHTASDTIIIHRLPSADIISFPADATVCAGDTLILCASTDAPAAGFDWNGPHDLSSTEQCLNFYSATPQQTGEYVLTVTDNNGCAQTANGSATVHPLPLAAINDAPANGIVCEGEPFSLCARPDAPIVAYDWNGPDGFSSSGQCAAFTTSTQSQSGIYTLTVTDENGCKNSADSLIQVAELPVLTIDTADAQVTAEASGGTGPYTFIIFGGNLEDTVILSEIGELIDGEYTIILTDANGCTDDATFFITDIADPIAEWGLTLSPNPSAGLFDVVISNDQSLPLKISIFDQTGRMLKTEVLRTRRSTLDLSASPAGLYLLRLFDGEKTGLAKVVVAR